MSPTAGGLGGGHSPGPPCTGHCRQHLDGGEGVICLSRQQVSLSWSGWHQAAKAGGPKDPCLRPTVFSHPVDGDGQLLLGSWQGSACSWRRESCGNPACRGQPAPGLFHSKGF